MRAKNRSRRSVGDRLRWAVATLLLVAAVLAALVSSATLAGSPLVADLGPDRGIVVLVGVAFVVLAVVGAVTATAYGSRRRAARTQRALAWFGGRHVCAAAARKSVPFEPKVDTSAERLLRLQIATLERALEGQDQRLAASVQDERRKVRLTIAALRRTIGHEPGEVALNRLEAALARLGERPGFTRPALPEGRTGAPVIFLAAPQPLVPAPAAVKSLRDPVVPVAADESAPVVGQVPARAGAPSPDLDASETAVEQGHADDDEGRPHTAVDTAPRRSAVRPVPAPVRPAAPRGRSRRLRRTTARV